MQCSVLIFMDLVWNKSFNMLMCCIHTNHILRILISSASVSYWWCRLSVMGVARFSFQGGGGAARAAAPRWFTPISSVSSNELGQFWALFINIWIGCEESVGKYCHRCWYIGACTYNSIPTAVTTFSHTSQAFSSIFCMSQPSLTNFILILIKHA